MKIPKSQIPTENNHRIGHCYRVLRNMNMLCDRDRILISVTPSTTLSYDLAAATAGTSDYVIPTGECSTTYRQLSDIHLYNLL